jgi:hypothetical protein
MALADLDDDGLLSSDNPIDFVFYAGKQAGSSRTELQKYHESVTLRMIYILKIIVPQ